MSENEDNHETDGNDGQLPRCHEELERQLGIDRDDGDKAQPQAYGEDCAGAEPIETSPSSALRQEMKHHQESENGPRTCE